MNPIFALGAIISGVVLLQGGMGLLTTLLPLQMQEAGYSSSEIGIMAAGFAGGFLIGCIWAPHLVARIGHIRAFSVFAAGMSALTLGFALGVDLYLWTAIRLISGICFAGLLNVSDSWISGETDKSIRGRVLATYMVLYKLAQAAGPILLTLGEMTGYWQIMLVSAFFSLSLLPVALRHGGNPTAPSTERMNLLDVYRLTPIGVFGCISIGMLNSPITNLIPLYAAEIGLGVVGAVTLSSALQIGALSFQWPMGWASDKRDRRFVMIAGIGASAAVCLLIALLPPMPLYTLAALIVLLGGCSFSVYPVILAHASDFCEPKQMVPLCSTLMLAFAVGMVIGPLTASATMDVFGPNGLFLHGIFVAIPFIVFAIYRMGKRKVRPLEERGRFANVPASSTAIKQMNPNAPHPEVDESIEAAFGHDPDDETAGPEVPHYQPSSK
jgi:MFS family permease